VEIDSNLVKQAETLLALRSSRIRPAALDSERIVDYFPISAVLQNGYRSEPKSKASNDSGSAFAPPDWPRVTFVPEDWVVSENPATSGPYDVVLAMSVIKWIHLEHLDKGLVHFFRKCSASLVPGGHLVIELQTWDSYEKAIRPNHAPHFAENFQKLQQRPETSFTGLLKEQGLELCATSDALPRRISVYRKQ
jgi:7SK snRNA methylphosphate capping enzyme